MGKRELDSIDNKGMNLRGFVIKIKSDKKRVRHFFFFALHFLLCKKENAKKNGGEEWEKISKKTNELVFESISKRKDDFSTNFSILKKEKKYFLYFLHFDDGIFGVDT